MITCAAMLPLYQRLGMNRLVLACVVMMAGQLMNILPWGGPTARAVSALGVEMGDVFVPMIAPMVVTGHVVHLRGLHPRPARGAAPGRHPPGRRAAAAPVIAE
jgi:Mg2+/citrate symporter